MRTNDHTLTHTTLPHALTHTHTPMYTCTFSLSLSLLSFSLSLSLPRALTTEPPSRARFRLLTLCHIPLQVCEWPAPGAVECVRDELVGGHADEPQATHAEQGGPDG